MVFTQEHEELLVCAHHGLQKLEKKRFSIASDNLCPVTVEVSSAMKAYVCPIAVPHQKDINKKSQVIIYWD